MNVKDILEKEVKKRKESGSYDNDFDIATTVETRFNNQLASLKEYIEKELPKKVYVDYIAPLKDKPFEYSVEKRYDGARVLIHKKGNEIKVFSESGKDVTPNFPGIIQQANSLTTKDYILDCVFVPYVSGEPFGMEEADKYLNLTRTEDNKQELDIKLFVSDIVYFGKPLNSLQYYERRKILQTLSFTDNILESEAYVVNNRIDMQRAIELVGKDKASKGAIIKKIDSVYTPNKNTKSWINYLSEIPLELVVLDEIPTNSEEQTAVYSLGTKITKKEANHIEVSHLSKLDNIPVLLLGNTSNTNIKANRGDILLVNADNVFRHKEGKYYYSLSNPKVIRKLNSDETTNLERLDEHVITRGREIQNSEFELTQSKDSEVMTFPQRMLSNFNDAKDKKLKYVAQWHYRGHKLTEEERKKYSLDEHYLYKLDSIHCDILHEAPKGYLEGMTVLTPTSSNPEVDDMLERGEDAKAGKIRAVLKIVKPKGWLNFEGVAEDDGSTPTAPGVYTIVSKGTYSTLDTTENTIKLEYHSERGNVNQNVFKTAEKAGIFIDRKPKEQLKDLSGVWQYQIAHIGDKYIVLLRLLEENKTKELNQEMVEQIEDYCKKTDQLTIEQCKEAINDTLDGNLFRTEIAKKFNVDDTLIYRLQKHCNII